MPRTRLLRPHELTPDHLAAWAEIQESDARFDSPYFRPEFTQAVAAVRDDVEVAVLEEQGKPVGFFPFQRGRFNVGQPVGGRLSDFQGFVIREDVEWQPRKLVRDCRLVCWNFDHLLVSKQSFDPYCRSIDESPYLDLSAGYDEYEADRRKAGANDFRQALRKSRKAQRELGPFRFVHHTRDEQIFETLREWKSTQYGRTQFTDVFTFDWTVKLLRQVLRQQGDGFAGLLSALYVGDRLAAIHLGMRSRHVLHSWFPTFDISLSKYSVGLIMLLELARAAESLGIKRIDLGKGDERYKQSFMSGASIVATGSIARSPLADAIQRGWRQAREGVKRSPVGPTAQKVAGWIHPMREKLSFR